MKIRFLFFTFFYALCCNAQDTIVVQQLASRIQEVESQVNEISENSRENIRRLQKVNKLLVHQKKVLLKEIQQNKNKNDSLTLLIDEKNKAFEKVVEKLGVGLSTTNTVIEKSNKELKKNIQKNSSVGWIGFAIGLILVLVVYFLLRKRISSGSSTVHVIKNAQEKLELAHKQIQEETLKLDGRLVEILDRQIQVQNEKGVSGEKDHSLVLKVADEIVKIELNLSRMDSSVKGYKQLSKAVERMKNNFMAQGYEIVDMLGKPYNDGMRINADFVIDEDIPEGVRTITSIIKPQINYNGEMIQKATVTVVQNI